MEPLEFCRCCRYAAAADGGDWLGGDAADCCRLSCRIGPPPPDPIELEGICTEPDRWPRPTRGGMAGGGPRLGSDCCCGSRPGVADGSTGALILGGSDVEDEVVLPEVDEAVEGPDERGRAGSEGGCFDDCWIGTAAGLDAEVGGC